MPEIAGQRWQVADFENVERTKITHMIGAS
jgi:hypothetical protein